MPHNAINQRGFSYTIAAYQARALAARELQIDIPENMIISIVLIYSG
ncbi:hypothetical protein YPPY66_1557 [Yersinia pestis PY-66]|uniref:Uncharacterized protein n=1 Tax=Yersinia pestis PY-08 TaxID=992134 RepID=A0AB72ZQ27_YERPE|nr:hypothetical protein YPPY01_1320 [Yersinia pestis PY-01]EIQ92500.1 hypothetical protein YPPY02_1342 [Yersinia pestis PY-02]EIQ94324.1 hypothetical protein YPPY03_1417 [Yersinia pestis PY-03]EIR06518.1 hypothetical protein YPPY05_1354 [Yersinia pestis PY-05]EIR10019.1 hypothetical protein YPPY06_1388 [Yersinia pestis PY-06]EIR20624.1 hypothetical protein YPPY07_1296 [Yersinia pestis PY-07]EIR21622.1 hypothetical protein YPPY08_1396 [Yersinia pestis PY-08]EIR23444.1 hypothetical protein YPP